jgi:hypothetical protein
MASLHVGERGSGIQGDDDQPDTGDPWPPNVGRGLAKADPTGYCEEGDRCRYGYDGGSGRPGTGGSNPRGATRGRAPGSRRVIADRAIPSAGSEPSFGLRTMRMLPPTTPDAPSPIKLVTVSTGTALPTRAWCRACSGRGPPRCRAQAATHPASSEARKFRGCSGSGRNTGACCAWRSWAAWKPRQPTVVERMHVEDPHRRQRHGPPTLARPRASRDPVQGANTRALRPRGLKQRRTPTVPAG